MAIAIALALQRAAPSRVLKLDQPDDATTRRVISNTVELAEGAHRTWVTVTRTGSFTDPRYGRFEITALMLAQMVRNFDAGIVGTDIFIDVDHKPGAGAAAKVLALKVDNGRLRAQVEWTEYGVEAVRIKRFSYLSAEFDENYHDNEAGAAHGCVLLGAGLTIRPVIKRLDPVTLAVAGDSDHSGPVFVHPGLVRQLTDSLEQTTMNRWKKYLAALAAAGITLSQAQIDALKPGFDAATKALAEDADDQATLDQWTNIAKQIGAQGTAAVVQLSIAGPATGADEINAAVTKALADRDAATKLAAAEVGTATAAFTAAMAAATGLSEGTQKQLGEAVSLIGPGWTADQAKALAAQQIKSGEAIEASRQLAQMGFGPAGSVRVSIDETNGIKSLAVAVHKGLKSSYLGDQLKLPDPDKLTPFQAKVLAEFDAANAPRLHAESKMLAGGAVTTTDLNIPASYQRAVILESLADNRVLDLVSANVDAAAGPTHTIPYERRDTSAIANDGVVYEGAEIPPGGVSIENDYAYIVPMKISLDLTNESIFFSRNSALINYDAWARTLMSNAQVMRENVARRIANHMQRESGAYGAVAEVAVVLTQSAAAPGTYRVPVGKFPIVRPWQPRDLKGTAIGAPQQPVVVRVGIAPGVAVPAYDGSGTQPAANYYRVVNYNLGLVQIVNQLGVVQAGLTVQTDFWRETNVALFDMDLPANVDKGKHFNGLIQLYGARKALMAQDRFVVPNFGLMSYTLNDEATNAEQFTAQAARADSSITVMGDLAGIKGIPSWATNAPNIDLGEERILLGQRGAMSYTIAKPFAVGTPFEAVGATGRPTGRKIAYGEEFSSIHVPSEYRDRFTSIVAYSATARAA